MSKSIERSALFKDITFRTKIWRERRSQWQEEVDLHVLGPPLAEAEVAKSWWSATRKGSAGQQCRMPRRTTGPHYVAPGRELGFPASAVERHAVPWSDLLWRRGGNSGNRIPLGKLWQTSYLRMQHWQLGLRQGRANKSVRTKAVGSKYNQQV